MSGDLKNMAGIVCLVVGSTLGGLARYFFGGLVSGTLGTAFPLGTLAVNTLGCFLIGLFSSLAGERFFLSPNAKLLLMTGFCGAFTTFSAFILETDSLLKDGYLMKALLNILLSLLLGFIFFRIGIFLGKLI